MAPAEFAGGTAATPPAHFVLVPLVSPGHIIPLVDLARLLAEHGARVSIVTTPLHASRLCGIAEHAARAGLALEFIELPFPPADSGLPPDCQSVDMLADSSQTMLFFDALRQMASPFECYVRALSPRPSCIIYDWCCPWTAGVARSLCIPRLFFHPAPCLFMLCELLAVHHGLHERLASSNDDQQHLAVPGAPIPVTVTKATVPGFFITPPWKAFRDASLEAMRTADGAVLNTCSELEAQFLASYEAALGKPVWAVGPLCLANRDDADATASRGNKLAAAAVTKQQAITAWLDGQAPGTVLYVSFGSISRKLPKQLFEVGHGLEDAGKPFLWVVKESEAARPEAQQWLEALEERTAGRGLVVRGWVPQLAVLSHPAVGGFLTHCGWNSILEAITVGVPLVTWPHFSDQFLSEQVAVEVLGVGVPIGNKIPVSILDDPAVPVVRGDMVRAVLELMGDGKGASQRRKTKECREKAHRAMDKGGSSYRSITRLIQRFSRSGDKTQL